MPRPVILFSGQWSDLSLKELVSKASEWDYQGLELCAWGDHLDVYRIESEPEYCQGLIDLLAQHDMQVPVLGCYRTGQGVCDRIEPRHKKILSARVWGDGEPRGIRGRAIDEMLASVRAAQKLGVGVVSSFTGSSLWAGVTGYPPLNEREVDEGLREFADLWQPIFDLCRDLGVRFALEIHPGQVAFDLYSAERVLEAVEGREEFGFTVDPSHFHWQGLDPAMFVRRFPDRIFHVHMKDVALSLDGRSSILNSYLQYGNPRRGWEFRGPGHGGVDWENFMRALAGIGYEGPLCVEWKDMDIERSQGTAEACQFVKRLDFERAPR